MSDIHNVHAFLCRLLLDLMFSVSVSAEVSFMFQPQTSNMLKKYCDHAKTKKKKNDFISKWAMVLGIQNAFMKCLFVCLLM